MQLDQLFIIGATDANLPGSFTDDPAITPAQSGMNSEWFNNRASQVWQDALRSAENVTVSYPRSSLNGDVSGQPSSWILQWMPAKKEDWHTLNFDSTQLIPPTQRRMSVLRAGSDSTETSFDRIRRDREKGTLSAYNGFIDSEIGARYLLSLIHI